MNINHISAGSVDYTLYAADGSSDRSIFFYPGMACNRYGHPVHREPRNSVEDLVGVAHGEYNLIFPEIHMPDSIPKSEPIAGLTVDEQNERMIDVISHVSKKIEFKKIIFVGQSLGCLAVAQLVSFDVGAESADAIFWGPPTIEGRDHKDMLISKFASREGTNVNIDGTGSVQFGDGRLMSVTPGYWDSLDNNSLRTHNEAMLNSYSRITAICASDDNFYPNNAEYFNDYLPGIPRVEIPGESHTFKEPIMREELRRVMADALADHNQDVDTTK